MAETGRKTTVGKRIREMRQAKGMSQEKLGEKLEVSFQAVSSWERGEFLPDPDRLPALAEELDISLDSLFSEEEHSWTLKPVNYDADHMFTFVKTRAREAGMVQTLAVMEHLRAAHERQPRWSKYGFDTTYMVHPLTLACHALAMGLKDDGVIAACLAHDMPEDAGWLPEDLPVDTRVREAVRLCSKNLCGQGLPGWEDRYYEAIRQNPLACLVKCLDRVHNLAGMADAFSRKKMAEYTAETDRYYPALLEVLKRTGEWNDAWWLLRYQMMTMVETFKRLL